MIKFKRIETIENQQIRYNILKGDYFRMDESQRTSELELIEIHLRSINDLSGVSDTKNKALEKGYIDLNGKITTRGKNLAKMVLADQSVFEIDNH